MSLIGKTVLATVVVGAGLGSMSGAALAHESAPASGCSNAVAAQSENGAGRTTGDTTGGDQVAGLENMCNFLNDNAVANENNVATAGSTIRNGDVTDTTETTTTTETSDSTTTAPGLGGFGDLFGGLF